MPRTALVSLVLVALPALADTSPPGGLAPGQADAWSFKFTGAHYATSGGRDATDLNLRANVGAHAMWIGHYERAGEFAQSRIGYEFVKKLPPGSVVASIGAATHGFVGGSVGAELGGDPGFALLGFGRTNLADYDNLNFDPNDSVTLGVGRRSPGGTTTTLYRVQDDRLGTGQRVTHLFWRRPLPGGRRWSVDLAHKRGSPVAGARAVSGRSLSITFDLRDVFVRVARDEKVNFSSDDMNRIAIGWRF